MFEDGDRAAALLREEENQQRLVEERHLLWSPPLFLSLTYQSCCPLSTMNIKLKKPS